jgi:PAS domain S-box-containing protein
MKRISYNAAFVNLKKSDVRLNSCILPISVGQEGHEGKKFIATMKLVNKHFNNCTIAVCDTLQRHSLATVADANQDTMYSIARMEGDKWIERNKPICDDYLDIPCTIKRWDDWFRTEDYFLYKDKVRELYLNDPKFIDLVDNLVQAFIKRIEKRGHIFYNEVATTNSKEYILEECAATCIWYKEGYDFDLYPGVRSEAIEYILSQVKKDVHGKLLIPVALKFNTVQTFDSSTSKFALEKIINILPGQVYWKDADGKVLGCNEAQAKLHGFKSAELLVGKYDTDIIRANIAEKVRKNDKEIMESKQICTFEEEAFVNGLSKWFLSQKAPILGVNDAVLGVVGVSIDITDKKKLEKSLIKQTKSLEEALKVKTRFLNNLSHELRSPLHVLMAITEELHGNINSLSKEEVQEFLDMLLKNNKRLLELVNNLLDLAKSKQGKTTYSLEKKNIVIPIQETISEFASVAPIALKTDCNEVLTHIDALKISQVVRNLVSNAIRYGDKDSIIVEVKQLDAQNQVLIRVKNKGIGIPEAEREKVFDPFFQSSKTSAQGVGTGLGLSICKEIIFAHKGSIWIDQDDLGMTCVNFTVPCPDNKENMHNKDKMSHAEEKNTLLF